MLTIIPIDSLDIGHCHYLSAVRGNMDSMYVTISVVVEDRFRDLTTYAEIMRLSGFKSSLTSIIIESTYLTLNMNKILGCFEDEKNAFYELMKHGSRGQVSAEETSDH